MNRPTCLSLIALAIAATAPVCADAAGRNVDRTRGARAPAVLAPAATADQYGPTNPVALDRTNLRMVGLTADGRLLAFRERDPADAASVGYVTGLQVDVSLVGIDYRVQDGQLYGVGNAGGVYVINAATAGATFVQRIPVALGGTRFGVDFNPAADRLRIVSDTGQNLRHNINTNATLEDGGLNYTAGTAASGIAGAAYTNNDLVSTTGTTLFDLDVALDQVALQSPPNNGSLAATGKLGADVVGDVGFDIYTAPRKGAAFINSGYAVASDATGRSTLHAIDLLTGAATPIGSFDEAAPVVDLAIPLAQR
jgi:hypothetical protein